MEGERRMGGQTARCGLLGKVDLERGSSADEHFKRERWSIPRNVHLEGHIKMYVAFSR